jgi:hypothetical protein
MSSSEIVPAEMFDVNPCLPSAVTASMCDAGCVVGIVRRIVPDPTWTMRTA